MSELHIGPHTKTPHDPHPKAEAFDREINVKAIFKTIGGLVAVAVVVHLLMWWLIKGFNRFDDTRAAAPQPLPEANVQPAPPEPRLQTSPEEDLRTMRAQEDNLLGQPGWVDQRQGTVRVPIETAMEVIAARGLGAEVVGGVPGAAGAGSLPQQIPGQGVVPPQAGTEPGALVQMSRQPGQAQTVQPAAAAPAQATPPPPQERR